MATWDVTHGSRTRGGYRRIGASELYVRQVTGSPRWEIFVDGRLEGQAEGEIAARAVAEFAVRCMVETGTAGETAAA